MRFGILSPHSAPSRRAEVAGVRDVLKRELSSVKWLELSDEQATCDGGDVLVVGSTVFVGRSTRTNDAAIVS